MRDLVNCEQIYKISQTGEVFSVKRNRFLKPAVNSRGYFVIVLSRGGNKKSFTIHQLVAQAYLPNLNGFKEINHKDGNKENNNANNLEWCSHSHNMKELFKSVANGTYVKMGTRGNGKRTRKTPTKSENQKHCFGWKFGDNPKAKKVIEIETGKIFGSAAEIAHSIGFTPRAFQKRLSGELRNSTGYSYL